jgi:hypothetical protein
MSKLLACIISNDKQALVEVARTFAHAIEMLDDGVLFDVSGLERLIGKPDRVAEKILAELQKQNLTGSVAVAETSQTAILLARHDKGLTSKVQSPDTFQKLPLNDLDIEPDTLNVFRDLGMATVEDLLEVPRDELVGRYGRDFERVIDTIEQKAASFITPNIKESSVAWNFDLDTAVEDFEQLIFIVNHGLDSLFRQVAHFGHSTEHLDITFKLWSPLQKPARSKGINGSTSPHVSKGETSNPSGNLPVDTHNVEGSALTDVRAWASGATTKTYRIKTSFPTLDKAFWLKLINLRISLDAPEAGILGVSVVSHFTRPRPAQRGLYAVSRPEPESLLLTVGKLKKLVGKENVGVPVMLNQRLAEPFILDADAMPDVNGSDHVSSSRLGRSICGEARLTDESSIGPAAMPPLSRHGGGIAADPFQTGAEKPSFSANRAAEPLNGIIAFRWFRPPVRTEVLVRDGRLIFIKTRYFAAHVLNYSGVWRSNARWWDRPWRTQEWDIEVEGHGVYRLSKGREDWFVIGEYD